MKLEKDIEVRFREKLQAWGFQVLKLTTPGHQGVPDRMILQPKYSPGPPTFVEFKRMGGRLSEHQKHVHADWRARGCVVHEAVWSDEDADALVDKLVLSVRADYIRAQAELSSK